MEKKKGAALRISAIVILVIMLLYTVLALWPSGINYKGENKMLKEGELPILIAHGGGNREFPDNTLEAFYNAYSVDKNVMMETDVSITKDGVVILSHDTTLDRKTNVTGAISEHNYSDLKANKVDFGYTNKRDEQGNRTELIPFTTDEGKRVTPLDVEYPEGVSPASLERDDEVFMVTSLEDLLVSFPNNRINVEIKQSGELGKRCLYAVLALLRKYDAFDRVVLASFHNEITEEFMRLYEEREVPEGFMFSPDISGVIKYYILHLSGLDVFYTDPVCALQIPMEEYGFKLATPQLVYVAHTHGIATHFWTINEKADMEYLIEIGADGIMTDYPHRLKEVYDSYGG